MLVHGLTVFLLLELHNNFALAWDSSEIRETPLYTPNEVDMCKQKNELQKGKTKKTIHDGENSNVKIIHEKRECQKDMVRDPFESIFDSFLQPLMLDGENKKKPKMKTVMSLTEIISPPKHIHLSANGHIPSPFGMKDSFFMEDPFDEISRFMSFLPDYNRLGLLLPCKQSKDRTNKSVSFGENCHYKKILSPRHIRLITHQEKTTTGPNLVTSLSQALDGPSPTSLNVGHFMQIEPLEEKPVVEEINLIDDSGHTCPIVKALPYIIGALGGVMTALILVVLVTWRTKRTNTVWARIPLIESTVPEKA